ncbi:MAG TPA: hypothetical protein PLN71_13850 [Anaerolineae bacterium]|nr:hypothetical protein [Anaerolineae bacterium]
MTIHDLLAQTETTLATLAVSGFANAGPMVGELATLADEMAAVGLGKLGERLRAVEAAPDDRTRVVAWTAAWTGVGLVRTRLLKPTGIDIREALALPQCPNVLFPRPAGDLESLDGLLTALQSPQPFVRAYAAGRLAELGDEAVPGLLAVQKQSGRCIRFLVIETLARIGTDAALTGLVGLLGDNDVARPLEAALLTFGARAIPVVAGALAQQKDKGKEKHRRRAAAKILWRLGGAQPLRAVLDDEDELVKAYARAALHPPRRWDGWNKWPALDDWPAAVVCFERGDIPPETLTERLDALPKSQLNEAAAVLWHTGAEELLLAHYLAQITAETGKKAREHAILFIARLAHPAAAPTLLSLAANDPLLWTENTRLASEGLAELADSTAVWPLIHAAGRLTPSPYSRAPLIATLGRIGDPAATPALLEMLEETAYPAERDTLEKALSAIGAPAAEAIAHALEQRADATLERVLARIKTPQAQAALAAYRAGTDDLSRLIAHLADGKASESVIRQTVRQGSAALDPLFNLLEKGSLEGQIAAVRVLGQLAPVLAAEQREQVLTTLRAQLRAQCAGQLASPYVSRNPLAEQLVSVLCELDVGAALPEIRDALVVAGVAEIVLESWQRKQSPWLLDVIAQGIGTPVTRPLTIRIARSLPLDERTRPHLWPPMETIMRTENDPHVLWHAVLCLQKWGDGQAVPLLQALKKRLGAVSGPAHMKESLKNAIEAARIELSLKKTSR